MPKRWPLITQQDHDKDMQQTSTKTCVRRCLPETQKPTKYDRKKKNRTRCEKYSRPCSVIVGSARAQVVASILQSPHTSRCPTSSDARPMPVWRLSLRRVGFLTPAPQRGTIFSCASRPWICLPTVALLFVLTRSSTPPP